jgi:hypothetical protein
LCFHLIFFELVLCYFHVGRCDDPICVHFVFKCKILNNALILGSSTIFIITCSMCLFQLVLLIVGRQNYSFWYLVCHHKKCGEFDLFVGTLLSLGVAYLIPYHLFLLLKWDMSLSMCLLVIFMLIGFCFVHLLNFGANLVLIGFLDIIWTTFSFHTFVWLLGLLGVLFKLNLFLALESIVHAFLLNV